jgi:hypothetical protein
VKDGSSKVLVTTSTNRPSKRERPKHDEKRHVGRRDKKMKCEKKTRPSAAMRARRKARNLVRKATGAKQ